MRGRNELRVQGILREATRRNYKIRSRAFFGTTPYYDVLMREATRRNYKNTANPIMISAAMEEATRRNYKRRRVPQHDERHLQRSN